MRRVDKARTRPVARAVAVATFVFVLFSGTALTVGAQTSGGVSCSAGSTSIEVSWEGEFRAYEYTATMQDSSGSESEKTVDWSQRTTGTASVTFTGLTAGDYTVSVVMQTVDGSWITIGQTSCTVEAAETTTTTTATTTTTTTLPSVTFPSPENQAGGHSPTTPSSPEGQVGGL